MRRWLGKGCLIEHFGSTAIGISGKGVVDIIIGFNNQTRLNEAIPILENRGYIKDNAKREERIFMSSTGEKESGPGDFHLHLVLKQGRILAEAVAFRDYLTSHPREKKQYAKLKYQLAKKVGKNRALYTKLKGSFIEKAVRRVRKP